MFQAAVHKQANRFVLSKKDWALQLPTTAATATEAAAIETSKRSSGNLGHYK